MTEPTPPDEVQVSLAWEAPDDLATPFVNQFLIQHQKGEFVLTFGVLVPPPITAVDLEERRKALASMPYIPIKIVGRYGFTRQRLVELIDVLQTNLQKHDESFKAGDGESR
jgi:hypothetical protein